MRLPVTLCIAIASSGGFSHPIAGQPGPTPEVREYLLAALDTLEANVLPVDPLDGSALRDSALTMVAGARRVSDAYGAIAWALHRTNPHSFLQASPPGAVHELLPGSIGYIHVPQRGGAAVSLADSLHRALAELVDQGARAWVVDLRGNGGGNMWPMLAGIGPLLADSLVGSFGPTPDAEQWFYRGGLSGILRDGVLDTITRVTIPAIASRPTTEPVAVLMDAQTGSSGEALVVAFLGRPNLRTFGTPTAGFATVNRGSRLPDGANMVLTTGHYADRSRGSIGERIEPDTVISGLPPGWPFPTDRIGTAALRWLTTRIGGRDPSR